MRKITMNRTRLSNVLGDQSTAKAVEPILIPARSRSSFRKEKRVKFSIK